MKNMIFYFSGTGNSLSAARIIAKNLGGTTLISMREGTPFTSAEQAEVIGFVCPVYEWDVPETVASFLEEKGCKLSYVKVLRCVVSQCIAYEPFPPAKIKVPFSEKCTEQIGKKIAKK